MKQEKNIEDVINELGLKKGFVAKENKLSDKQMTFVINGDRPGGIYDVYTARVWDYLNSYKQTKKSKVRA